MDYRIGFIGVGNIGSILLDGIIGAGTVNPENVRIYDINEKLIENKYKKTGIKIMESNMRVTEESDIVFIAVKPDIVMEIINEIKDFYTNDKIIISVSAGIPIKMFKDILGAGCKIVRTMPNTPAMVGEGMTVMAFDEIIGKDEAGVIISLFECVGKTEVINENIMNEVIALTSSSPAYVFIFIEAMADAAVKSGIGREMSYRLAAQAVKGAAMMVLETGRHPAQLKDQVCSPAGTTIQAVEALEGNSFRYVVMEAMGKCTQRARELAGKK